MRSYLVSPHQKKRSLFFRTKFTLIIFILMSSLISKANDQTYPKDEMEDGNTYHRRLDQFEEDEITPTSSKTLRQNKTLEFFATIYNISGVISVPGGITAGYFLNSDSLIELSYLYGKPNDSQGLLRIEDETYIYDLNYKKIWRNSFYTNIGLGLRNVKRTVTEPRIIAITQAGLALLGSESSKKINIKSQTIELAVGNQWQWETLTLGCDWMGFMIPFKQTSSDVSNSKYRYDSKGSENDVTVYFLRFYLGIAF